MISVKVTGLKRLQKALKDTQRNLEREAKRLNGGSAGAKIEPDDKGFVDHQCPSCLSEFKIRLETVTGDNASTTCPYCGHVAPNDEWYTETQIAQFREAALGFVEDRFDEALKPLSGYRTKTIRPIRRSQQLQHVSIESNGRYRVETVPLAAARALNQERHCSRCKCHFAFIGSAFFCPECGDNPSKETFEQSVAKIRENLTNLSKICEGLDEDQAREVSRTLTEKGLQDLVTAFQRMGEHLYRELTGDDAPKNAFQRLKGKASGPALWQEATGHDFESYLDKAKFERMKLLYQRRHLLSHTEGLVDQPYLNSTGDTEYQLGQRIVVRVADVEELASLVEQLVKSMSDE